MVEKNIKRKFTFKEFAENSGMSQLELGDSLGYCPSYISVLVSGKRAVSYKIYNLVKKKFKVELKINSDRFKECRMLLADLKILKTTDKKAFKQLKQELIELTKEL